jgi:ABC-type Fe3+ transport system permease subunit
MRDLLIGFGYFGVVLLIALLGLGLIVQPQRYHVFLSRARFARSNRSYDLQPAERRHWRMIGVVMLILGSFMFLLPLTALDTPQVAPNSHPHTEPNGWPSALIWILFLVMGVCLALKPKFMLGLFRSNRNQKDISEENSLTPARVIGVLFALGALFVLVHFRLGF